jgi:hypothetical protein
LLQPAEAAAPTIDTFVLGQATISIEQDLPQGMVAVTPSHKAAPEAHFQAIRATIDKPMLKHANGAWNYTTTTKRRRRAAKNDSASVRVDSRPAGQSPPSGARPGPFNAAQMAQGAKLKVMIQQHKEQDQQLASRLPASQLLNAVPAPGTAKESAKVSLSSVAVPAPEQARPLPVSVASPGTATKAVTAVAPAVPSASLLTVPPAALTAPVTLSTPAEEVKSTSLLRSDPQAAQAHVAAASRHVGDAAAQPPHNETASSSHITCTEDAPVDDGYKHANTLQTTGPSRSKRPPASPDGTDVAHDMLDSDSHHHAVPKKQKSSTAPAEGDNKTPTSS